MPEQDPGPADTGLAPTVAFRLGVCFFTSKTVRLFNPWEVFRKSSGCSGK